jgi:ribosome-binding factor A
MLRVHTVPSLHFVFDQSLERAMKLSVLISAANQMHTSDDDEQP